MGNFERENIDNNDVVLFTHWDSNLYELYENQILVLGDSHTEVFRFIDTENLNYFFPYICTVTGATSQGVININSKTDAFNIFNETINKYGKKTNKLLIMLGEVDCGFLIWVRAKKEGISLDEQIDLSINNLFLFIESILKLENNDYEKSDIIITGCILPVVHDNKLLRTIHGTGIRAEAEVSQKLRTEKTLEYNQKLKTMCLKNGFQYIDITSQTMGSDKLLDDNYKRGGSGSLDPHLDNIKSGKLWREQIMKLLETPKTLNI